MKLLKKALLKMPIRVRAVVVIVLLLLGFWVPVALAWIEAWGALRRELREAFDQWVRALTTAAKALATGRRQ